LSAIHPPELRPAWPADAVAAVSDLSLEAAELRARVEQLQHALDSRIVIEQAKGMLAERLGLPLPDSFEVLRRAARSTQVRLHDLAAEVIQSPSTPAAVAREIARRRREEG
jgi:AmiR/NasT family two-component response regulator